MVSKLIISYEDYRHISFLDSRLYSKILYIKKYLIPYFEGFKKYKIKILYLNKIIIIIIIYIWQKSDYENHGKFF